MVALSKYSWSLEESGTMPAAKKGGQRTEQTTLKRKQHEGHRAARLFAFYQGLRAAELLQEAVTSQHGPGAAAAASAFAAPTDITTNATMRTHKTAPTAREQSSSQCLASMTKASDSPSCDCGCDMDVPMPAASHRLPGESA